MAFQIGQFYIVRFIIVLMFGIIPDLHYRINYLNGSLDESWTMIFGLLGPIFMPFNIVPATYHLMGWIKKGKGGIPFDFYVMIPVISFFVTYVAANAAAKQNINIILILVVKLLTIIASGTLAFYLHSKKSCQANAQRQLNQQNKKHKKKGISVELQRQLNQQNKNQQNKNQQNENQQNENQQPATTTKPTVSIKQEILVAFQSAVLLHALTVTVTMILDFVPPIDWIMFGIEQLAPFISVAITAAIYASGYLIINMLNGFNENKYCAGEAITYLPPVQKQMLLVYSLLVISLQQYSEYIMMDVDNAVQEGASEVENVTKEVGNSAMTNLNDSGSNNSANNANNANNGGNNNGQSTIVSHNHHYYNQGAPVPNQTPEN